ncbi:MAG: hypothetical protein AAF629_16510 [Chloroflexota bacterium]
MKPIRLILTLTGIILLIVLVIWIISSLSGTAQPDLAGEATDIGILANRPVLPIGISTEIDRGRDIIAAQNSQFRTLSFISELCMWISLAATAVITLMTGAFNLPKPGGDDDKAQEGRFHFLGLMAAVASICTLIAAQTGSMAEQRVSAADEIEDVISAVAAEVRANPEHEPELLIRLGNVLGKYE